MKRRLGLLYWTLHHRNLSGPWRHWIYNTLGPDCSWWGKRRIKRISQEGDYSVLRLHGLKHPLFYPEKLPLRPLYQVITELLYDWNWHYYQMPQTTTTANDVVYDCGSAEGLFALQAAEKGATVFAFEPLPAFADCLSQTLSPFPQAHVENLALGAEATSVYLAENGIYSTIEKDTGGTAIQMSTIDQFVAAGGTPPTYIKADIEGLEPELLAGATQTIREHQPRIAITVYHEKSHETDLQQTLSRIVPEYQFQLKGIAAEHGNAVMLHAWVE